MSRNKYPEETVKLILDTALKLFLEKGYEKTTVQDIVDNLGGLSKGALYYHFKSKEELLLGVANNIFTSKHTEEEYAACANLKLSAKARLGAVVNTVLHDAAENELRLIYPDLKTTPQFLVQMLLAVDSPVAKMISEIFEQGVREGCVKTEYPEQMGQVFMTLMNMWINPYVWPVSEQEMRQKLGCINELLVMYGFDTLEEMAGSDAVNEILDMAKKRDIAQKK